MAMNFLSFRAAGISSRLGMAGENVFQDTNVLTTSSALAAQAFYPRAAFRTTWESLVFPQAAGGGSSITWTTAGGLTLSGTGVWIRSFGWTATGGLTFSGAGTWTREETWDVTGPPLTFAGAGVWTPEPFAGGGPPLATVFQKGRRFYHFHRGVR
jgi:hypothetical protein